MKTSLAPPNDSFTLAPGEVKETWTQKDFVLEATEPVAVGQVLVYESRTCTLTAGAHKMAGDKSFGITAYGYGRAGSYAFVGGANVTKIYVPPVIK